MIDSVKLSQFAEELSNTPCPVCGKCHKVVFKVEKEVIFYSFPEEGNICLGFREFVIKRLNNSPSRYIKLLW